VTGPDEPMAAREEPVAPANDAVAPSRQPTPPAAEEPAAGSDATTATYRRRPGLSRFRR